MGHKATVRKILRRAAERIELGLNGMTCLAIIEAGMDVRGDHYCVERFEAKAHYNALFSPNLGSGGATYWDKDPTTRRQQQRIDCLLLAAASYEG